MPRCKTSVHFVSPSSTSSNSGLNRVTVLVAADDSSAASHSSSLVNRRYRLEREGVVVAAGAVPSPDMDRHADSRNERLESHFVEQKLLIESNFETLLETFSVVVDEEFADVDGASAPSLGFVSASSDSRFVLFSPRRIVAMRKFENECQTTYSRKSRTGRVRYV
jgi:hypothetical protein